MKLAVKALKALATLVLLGIVFWSVVPFHFGVYSIGSYLPLAVCGWILAMWYVPGLKNKLQSVRIGKWFYRAVSVLLIAGLGYSAVLAGLILSAQYSRPAEGNATLVVLGCQVRGSSPSLMLASRLNTAEAYLNAHPDSVCVLSGGQGDGEDITEAEAMRQYLTARGISENRLYLEDQSTSTLENLTYSTELIVQNDLPQTVVIVTNDYHAFRSGWMMRGLGLDCSLDPAPTPWYLYFCGFVREMLAVTKYWVLG